jgi:hypothetical protein
MQEVAKFYNAMVDENNVDYDSAKNLFKKAMNSWVFDCENWTNTLNSILESDKVNTCLDFAKMPEIYASCR